MALRYTPQSSLLSHFSHRFSRARLVLPYDSLLLAFSTSRKCTGPRFSPTFLCRTKKSHTRPSRAPLGRTQRLIQERGHPTVQDWGSDSSALMRLLGYVFDSGLPYLLLAYPASAPEVLHGLTLPGLPVFTHTASSSQLKMLSFASSVPPTAPYHEPVHAYGHAYACGGRAHCVMTTT